MLFLAGAVIGEFEQAALEFPIIRFINGFTHRSLMLDGAMHALTTLVLPYDVDPNTLNHFNSFPSDHGVVFFGLAAIIYRLSPRLVMAAFVWAVVIDIARVYDGYHYPSDIVGAAGLGLLMAWLSQRPPVLWLAGRVPVFEQRRQPMFHTLAILATYQIASLFDDLRELGSLFAKVVLRHDPFHGG